MIRKFTIAISILMLCMGCLPTSPYQTFCSESNQVVEGTDMFPITDGVADMRGEPTNADDSVRYCFVRDGDVGNGRLEKIAQDRITLAEYLVVISCQPGDIEVASVIFVQKLHSYWDKYSNADKYFSSGKPVQSNGNYCYGNGNILYTDNYTSKQWLSPVVYSRLDVGNPYTKDDIWVLAPGEDK